MELWIKFLDFLKLPLKIIIYVSILLGILFFSPPIRNYFLLAPLYSRIGVFVGPIFFISFTYLLFSIVCLFLDMIRKIISKKKERLRKESVLNTLSRKEVFVLREFFLQESDVIQVIESDDGVQALLSKGGGFLYS